MCGERAESQSIHALDSGSSRHSCLCENEAFGRAKVGVLECSASVKRVFCQILAHSGRRPSARATVDAFSGHAHDYAEDECLHTALRVQSQYAGAFIDLLLG